MQHCINVGVDLHDGSLVLRWAVDRDEPCAGTFSNDARGLEDMIRMFQEMCWALPESRVLFAYEASSQGFGLYDRLWEAGFECAVLAPTRMPRSAQDRKSKDDARDALRILDMLRAHVLAGCKLPGVWVPDAATRDDREVVRARLDLSDKLTGLKSQVRTLLKRSQVRPGPGLSTGWTRAYKAWLHGLDGQDSPLRPGAKVALRTLLVQMETIEQQIRELDEEVAGLSKKERYGEPVSRLVTLKGVGLLTAMVFLTELGELGRFSNRREVGAYLGLVPSRFETGEANDRKGPITRQGPSRVRRALCQAAWSRVRTDAHERRIYEGICLKNPKHKKKGVVAIMRRLGVRMWHIGLRAQQEAPALAAACEAQA
jgi:transposase